MNQITIHANLATEFRLATDDTRLVDDAGNVLGKFVPAPPLPQPPYGIESPYTTEELNRRAEGTGQSLADFWKSMGRTAKAGATV